jgi:hypothetical protein
MGFWWNEISYYYDNNKPKSWWGNPDLAAAFSVEIISGNQYGGMEAGLGSCTESSNEYEDYIYARGDIPDDGYGRLPSSLNHRTDEYTPYWIKTPS